MGTLLGAVAQGSFGIWVGLALYWGVWLVFQRVWRRWMERRRKARIEAMAVMLGLRSTKAFRRRRQAAGKEVTSC